VNYSCINQVGSFFLNYLFLLLQNVICLLSITTRRRRRSWNKKPQTIFFSSILRACIVWNKSLCHQVGQPDNYGNYLRQSVNRQNSYTYPRARAVEYNKVNALDLVVHIVARSRRKRGYYNTSRWAPESRSLNIHETCNVVVKATWGHDTTAWYAFNKICMLYSHGIYCRTVLYADIIANNTTDIEAVP